MQKVLCIEPYADPVSSRRNFGHLVYPGPPVAEPFIQSYELKEDYVRRPKAAKPAPKFVERRMRAPEHADEPPTLPYRPLQLVAIDQCLEWAVPSSHLADERIAHFEMGACPAALFEACS
jgi:hypothetical protein